METFRMEGKIRFNRAFVASDSVLLGGYKMRMNERNVFFDFNEVRSSISDETLEFICINPDYEFEDTACITEEMLENIERIDEFIVDAEYNDENNQLVPKEILELSFIFPYKEWKTINVPEHILREFSF